MNHTDDLRRATRMHQDCWPISLKWKPRMATMSDWTEVVNAFLRMKHQLDRQRAQESKHDGR